MMFKKFAAAALLAIATASVVSAPASAEPVSVQAFTVVKQTSGSGRTLTLWRNSSNGLVHGNLSGARYGDTLSIGNCCYPYTTYESVTSNGSSELNTREYTNGDPTIRGKFAEGGEIYK